jgi:hypothetical protein
MHHLTSSPPPTFLHHEQLYPMPPGSNPYSGDPLPPEWATREETHLYPVCLWCPGELPDFIADAVGSQTGLLLAYSSMPASDAWGILGAHLREQHNIDPNTLAPDFYIPYGTIWTPTVSVLAWQRTEY